MKKKLLFIDRDGTIIKEPPVTYQVDRLDQLSFLKGTICNLNKIQSELDFQFVMVTNQDGLGTENYPDDSFNQVQNKMLEILDGEGISFMNIHIDKSFEIDGLDTRKPGTGMLKQYMNGEYDLENSYVIGDRMSDIKLAKNLGTRSLFIKNNETIDDDIQPTKSVLSWTQIYEYLSSMSRVVEYKRTTNETDISIALNLNGRGKYNISTGLEFFDHMLEQLSKHSGIDMDIVTQGDLQIDEHHTIEDTGIALGMAFTKALGKKVGIERYGYMLPMDDCLAQVAIDFGGRPWIEWDAVFNREYVGDMPTEMFYHFFKSFSDASKCNLNIKAEGINEHHKIEAIFKAIARAIKMAVKQEQGNSSIPTTKGII